MQYDNTKKQLARKNAKTNKKVHNVIEKDEWLNNVIEERISKNDTCRMIVNGDAVSNRL